MLSGAGRLVRSTGVAESRCLQGAKQELLGVCAFLH